MLGLREGEAIPRWSEVRVGDLRRRARAMESSLGRYGEGGP